MTSVAPQITSNTPEVLRSILDPNVNLTLWQRPEQNPVARELARLSALSLRDVRRGTSLKSFDEDLIELLLQQGLEPSDFENLRKDMKRLIKIFSPISKGQPITFRLLTTNRDDCKRFHLDRTRLRLMCTYRGPGTEWLPEGQLDRAAQSRGAPNESIIRFGKPSQFNTFWVGIAKGDPDNTGQGLVHRSPAIAEAGHTRVFFCLDC